MRSAVLFTFLFCLPIWAEKISEEAQVPTKIDIWGGVVPSASGSKEYKGQVLSPNVRETTRLSDVLETSPSLIPKNSGGDNSTPSYLIRGQDSIQNRFFFEGIPLTDAEFNQNLLSGLPLESLSSLNVYPEGVPLFLAQDGLSGAINFRLHEISLRDKTLVSLRAGSFGNLRVFGRTQELSKKVRVSVEAARSQENFSYLDDNGTPFNPQDDKFAVRENNQFQRLSLIPHFNLYESKAHKVDSFHWWLLNKSEVPGSVSSPLKANYVQLSGVGGIHGTGVHVDVRVNFNSGDIKPTPLERECN
jgi:hypothetical protein